LDDCEISKKKNYNLSSTLVNQCLWGGSLGRTNTAAADFCPSGVVIAKGGEMKTIAVKVWQRWLLFCQTSHESGFKIVAVSDSKAASM
jgi:hypothetical protein